MIKASPNLRVYCSRDLCLLPVTVLASAAGGVGLDPGLHPTHHLIPNALTQRGM